MQKIQLGLRQEHVVYLKASCTAVDDVEAEGVLIDVVLLDDLVFWLELSSSSASDSIKITPEIRNGFYRQTDVPLSCMHFDHILASFGGNITQSSLSAASLLLSVASLSDNEFRCVFFSSEIGTGSPERLDIVPSVVGSIGKKYGSPINR